MEPELFARHLDTIVELGVPVLTVAELATALREDRLPERAVAITFDDGFASVATVAAPLLLARDLSATVFCVAGWLGRRNDWPSQPEGTPSARLATADELRACADSGIEIGAHGFTHAPLRGTPADLEREITEGRRLLEAAVATPVDSFAYPYGIVSSSTARSLVAQTYSAACTTELRAVTSVDDPVSLPRVDAHYLRRPELLRRALEGSVEPYLRARRLGARARSMLEQRGRGR